MSLSAKIFLGLFLGIFAGLFFGEKAAILSYGEEAFVLLLQMTVLPYIVVSLISGMGNLSLDRAKLLAKKAGIALVLLWGISLAVVLLTVLVYPTIDNATFFSTSMVQKPEPFNFIQLYIPANPFNALANNVVPAAVLFSIAVGLALMSIPGKENLIDTLNTLQKALGKVTNTVVKLTPLGIFAIAGNAAGTMDFSELKQLQVYIITYIVMSLFLTYLVLPLLVTTVTPLKYKQVVAKTKDMMLTAFMTGNLMIILPLLTEYIKECLHADLQEGSETDDSVDVIVSSSFNFPNAGKLLLLLFVVFAAWYSGGPLKGAQLPSFASMGLITLFGSSNVAFPFLFDILRIPQDMFQLFISLSVIHARFSTLSAAMHILVLGLLGSYSIAGLMKIRKRALVRYFIVIGGSTAALLIGLRILFTMDAFTPDYTKDKILVNMHLQTDDVQLWGNRPVLVVPDSLPMLDRIVQRGVIHVGYVANALPYAYRNEAGEAIGFDMDMAHQLAKELDVQLKVSKFHGGNLQEILDNDSVDIIMSGIPITTDLAKNISFTTPYMEEVLGFITNDHLVEKYENATASMTGNVLVPKASYFHHQLELYLPNVTQVQNESVRDFFRGELDSCEALFFTAERGSAWSLLYPEYAVAIPNRRTVRIPLAYMISRKNNDFLPFLNSWIHLKRNDGTVDRFYDYWILGKDAVPEQPRWSIMKDVLHWGE